MNQYYIKRCDMRLNIKTDNVRRITIELPIGLAYRDRILEEIDGLLTDLDHRLDLAHMDVDTGIRLVVIDKRRELNI